MNTLLILLLKARVPQKSVPEPLGFRLMTELIQSI